MFKCHLIDPQKKITRYYSKNSFCARLHIIVYVLCCSASLWMTVVYWTEWWCNKSSDFFSSDIFGPSQSLLDYFMRQWKMKYLLVVLNFPNCNIINYYKTIRVSETYPSIAINISIIDKTALFSLEGVNTALTNAECIMQDYCYHCKVIMLRVRKSSYCLKVVLMVIY